MPKPMQNIITKLENGGKKLILEVDLTQDLGPSASGKTILIASSAGTQLIAPGIFMGLNVFKKKV